MEKQDRVVYVVSRDAGGRELGRSEFPSEASAWNIIKYKEMNQSHLKHTVEDDNGCRLSKPVPQKSASENDRERERREADERHKIEWRLALRFDQQVKGSRVAFAEVRDNSSRKLYGTFPVEWKVVEGSGPNDWHVDGGVTLAIDTPDAAQLRRALREKSARDDGLPITAQVKGYGYSLRVSTNNQVALVFDVEPSDLWSFIRDNRFRRAREWGKPKSFRELTRRDADILRSVRTHRKVRPDGDQNEEANCLIEMGLISSPNGDLTNLHLTQFGTELLSALENDV